LSENLISINTEQFFLYGTLVLYCSSYLLYIAWPKLPVSRITRDNSFLVLSLLGQVMLSIVIAIRWARTGHGPFINLYEILLSNLWSLSLIYLLFFLYLRKVRAVTAVAAPVFLLFLLWLLLVSAPDTPLPATFDSIWLYYHVVFGKLFLGTLLIAAVLHMGKLLLETNLGHCYLKEVPGRAYMEAVAYRILALSFIFDSLMLVIGSIWAQDAWGRYWAWDPLETWSFLTWLSLVLVLHARYLKRFSDQLVSCMVIGTFLLAFVTFFGVPFLSTAPHKGIF
jgi:ABC-type transport system involved in cytochrome c biogenesis permease subunit